VNYKCDNCKGKGVIASQWINHLMDDEKICDKCRGTGEVNWIENIFGKQDFISIDSETYDFLSGSKKIYFVRVLPNDRGNEM